MDSDRDIQPFLPFSDLHIGAPTADLKLGQQYLDWALQEGAFVLGLGDICENSNKGSVGSGNYEQTMPPQDQQDMAVEMLRPVAEAGLLIGLIIGNHEWRSMNDGGLDITKNIADILRVPYLGYSIYVNLRIKTQRYTLFGTHGSGGSATLPGKINAIKKLTPTRHGVDIFTMGHVHDKWHGTDVIEQFNPTRKVVESVERHMLLTGAYLKYADSYGEMKGYSPSKQGSVRTYFHGDRKKITFDLSNDF